MKKLNFVHEWIGPHGPISNSKIPNIADFVLQSVRSRHPADNVTCIPNQGVDPLYFWMKKDFFKYINVYTPNTLPNDVTFIYEMELLHIRDWHSNFFQTKGIFENSNVSPLILEKIRNKQGYLMFSTIMESFLDDLMFNLIHDYLKTFNIPPSQVIYLTESPNCYKIYDLFCEKMKIKDKIICDYLPSWMVECRDRLLKSPRILANKYEPSLKNKTFLNLNRRYRQHRFVFLLEIFKRGLLDQFSISFDKSRPEGHESFLVAAEKINKQTDIYLTEEELHTLNNKLPLVLDNADFSMFPMEKTLYDTMHLYNDSLINVISETDFYTEVIQLTEKTFKPILYRQPFIMIGPPHSLQTLRDYGFKTFSDFWDESYDTIEDHELRMEAILEVISKISSMTDSQKIELSYSIKEIVEHNLMTLINRKPIEVHNFIEKYGSDQ
jgi:hypothetical protein